MSLRIAISAVIVLLLAILVVYPQFAPTPPVIDERQLVEPVVPIVVPEPAPPIPSPAPPPEPPKPEPPIPTPPPPQPITPTQPTQVDPGCAGGVCGLFPRLRARRGR